MSKKMKEIPIKSNKHSYNCLTARVRGSARNRSKDNGVEESTI